MEDPLDELPEELQEPLRRRFLEQEHRPFKALRNWLEHRRDENRAYRKASISAMLWSWIPLIFAGSAATAGLATLGVSLYQSHQLVRANEVAIAQTEHLVTSNALIEEQIEANQLDRKGMLHWQLRYGEPKEKFNAAMKLCSINQIAFVEGALIIEADLQQLGAFSHWEESQFISDEFDSMNLYFAQMIHCTTYDGDTTLRGRAIDRSSIFALGNLDIDENSQFPRTGEDYIVVSDSSLLSTSMRLNHAKLHNCDIDTRDQLSLGSGVIFEDCHISAKEIIALDFFTLQGDMKSPGRYRQVGYNTFEQT